MASFIPIPRKPNNSICQLDTLLPASFQTPQFKRQLPRDHIFEFLLQELTVRRLDIISKHLWLAGKPLPARPLQLLIALRRTIVAIGRADLHLLWFGDIIYIKPLPRFLLSVQFWEKYLVASPEIYCDAMGLLRSYMWLIGHDVDFLIAKDRHLIPEELTWREWRDVVQTILSQDKINHSIYPERYRYGELRLARVNAIYRFMPGVPNGSLIHGYFREYYTEYNTFFQRKFAWPVAFLAIITVVSSAMQVGLQTKPLDQNDQFQMGCYSFVVISLMMLIVLLIGGAALFFGLLIYNLVTTLWPKRCLNNRDLDTNKV